MSSMWRAAVIIAGAAGRRTFRLGAICARRPSYAPAVRRAKRRVDLARWRALRQSNGYRFSDYASSSSPIPTGRTPTECAAGPRKRCSRARMPRPSSPSSPPRSRRPATAGRGWPMLMPRAVSAARRSTPRARPGARRTSSATDEQAIWSRYGGSFTRADNDDRVDALLFAKKPDDAARFLAATSPERQAAFAARIAMQQNAPDADSRYQAVIGSVTRDAGLMMDRVRWLRANNYWRCRSATRGARP